VESRETVPSEGKFKTTRYAENWRWYVLGTLFLATFLCYFDRQLLGTAVTPIAQEFHLDNIQIGNLLSAFLWVYAWSHLFIGLIIDRIRNLRIFFCIMVIGWSITTMLVGFVNDYSALLWLRYFLGVWESVNFPICIMIISRIFPPGERSLAVGIFASGAFLATIVAPPFVVFFSNEYDWRYAFVIAGALSLLWVIPWLLIFRKPDEMVSSWDSYYQRTPLKAGLGNVSKDLLKNYFLVLRAPGFWGVVLLGFGITPSLYFVTQWLPTFLTQVFDVPFDSSLSVKLSVIYFMQDVGLWLGGAIVLILSNKGIPVLKSRKGVTLAALAIMPFVVIVPYIHSVFLCVIIFCVYVFCIGAALGNQHAFKQDIVKGKVAAVAALDGFIEMIFTWWFIKRIGTITQAAGDYTEAFFIMASLAVFGICVVLIFFRPKWIVIK
jgi:ACS family hexuronate transporter-like MFS transporter